MYTEREEGVAVEQHEGLVFASVKLEGETLVGCDPERLDDSGRSALKNQLLAPGLGDAIQ